MARRRAKGTDRVRPSARETELDDEEPEAGTHRFRRAAGRAASLGEAPVIVLKAASILEEELALGLGAAKRIEQRFLDVERLRSQPADALLSKFRRDAHEAVDILIDIMAAAATTVTERAGHIVNVTASRFPGGAAAAARPAPDHSQVPTVRMPGRVAAGETAELVMSLENDSSQATAEFTMLSSELLTSTGHRIAAERVRFDPPTLKVEPRATGQVKVAVQVPKGAPAGTYEGLLRATQLESLHAVLRVQVG